MLRFLSNYLFQNENQPNENDPSTTPISSSTSEQQEEPGPKGDDDDANAKKGRGKEEYMDFEEERTDDSDEEEEDDWVLIGEGEKSKKQGGVEEERILQQEDLTVQVQPVSLVAAPSDSERDGENNQEDSEEEDEEEDDEPGLLWENKLIEHPSMSVYVDLATSINTACTSMSSVAPATSPGESVIVIEDDEDDEDDDDESMDIIDVVPLAHAIGVNATPELVEVQEEMNPSDMENNVNSVSAAKSKQVAAAGGSTPVQNGRRKKGHYPCTSSNSSQMPRRAHLRSSGGNSRVNQTFQMISSNSWTAPNPTNNSAGQILDSIPDFSSKRKRSSNANNTTPAGTASACGIANVGGAGVSPTGTTPASNMINKNLKLVEMFPTGATSSKKRQRHSGSKANATPKGHFLQESKRRQDLQNCTKRAFVNNDRRSAQQRRVQKGAAGAPGNGARSSK